MWKELLSSWDLLHQNCFSDAVPAEIDLKTKFKLIHITNPVLYLEYWAQLYNHTHLFFAVCGGVLPDYRNQASLTSSEHCRTNKLILVFVLRSQAWPNRHTVVRAQPHARTHARTHTCTHARTHTHTHTVIKWSVGTSRLFISLLACSLAHLLLSLLVC